MGDSFGVRGGHQGISKTLKRVNRIFWWPRMKPSIAEYIQGCLVCSRKRAGQSVSPLVGLSCDLGAYSFGDPVSVDHVVVVTTPRGMYEF